jgi:hypothetical protein
MPILFESNVGSVVELVGPGQQCSTQLLGLDPNISFAAQRSIVTRVTVSQQVNVQFLHTLGALVYIYVFGDRIGQITLSGLSFSGGCNPDDKDGGVTPGVELMLNWYDQNRAANTAAPVRVMLGNYAINGFVVAATMDVVDPSTSLVQWGLTLTALPADNGESDKIEATAVNIFGPLPGMPPTPVIAPVALPVEPAIPPLPLPPATPPVFPPLPVEPPA